MQEGVKKTKVDNNYYVYLHRKRSDGTVFYVGKGKGKRAWDFSSRSKFWKGYRAKYGVTVELFQKDIQEWYAFELEQELILEYGRISLKTGCLVNLSEGGEGASGWFCSEEQVRARADRLRGGNNPLYRTEVHKFVNLLTNESFIGTRSEFYDKYKLLLDYGSSNTTRKLKFGWVIDGYLSEDQLQAISQNYGGKYCNRTDKNIYSFTNIITNEVRLCTRYEIEQKESISVRLLFTGRSSKVVSNWCKTDVLTELGLERILNPTKGVNNSRAIKTIYSFTNINTKEVYEGTRLDFEAKFNTKIHPLFHGYEIYNGWFITGNDLQNTKVDYTNYTFKHLNGDVFTGTRTNFATKYGFKIHDLFRKGRVIHVVKGWSLVPRK